MRRLLASLALGLAFGSAPGLADGTDSLALRRALVPPLGLPLLAIPADNPMTAEKIALGRKLFFDRRLSVNGTLSCAMCHVPEQGYAQNELATPVGIEGRTVRRNAPTIVNAAHGHTLFRDGRAASLEAQALEPLIDPKEMGNSSHDQLISRLRVFPDYAGLFERVFGRAADIAALAQALAAWQRTLLSGNSPFDRWRYGNDKTALSTSAAHGYQLFVGKAGCAACHGIGNDHALFTDHDYHNTGIGAGRARERLEALKVEIAPGAHGFVERKDLNAVSEPTEPDLGRFEVTRAAVDRWAYRTPSLRNVALTAPYMHDGSLATLAEVVQYYNRGGEPNSGLDPRLRPLGLTPADIADLVAFLESLTGANISDLVRDGRSVAVGNP